MADANPYAASIHAEPGSELYAATWIRLEQLWLLKTMRDAGPLRLFVLSQGRDKPGERHYDITGYQILPWILNAAKAWVSVTDKNLCAITEKGREALANWELHQFDPVDIAVMEPGRPVIPEATVRHA